jgi:hypothetical protein
MVSFALKATRNGNALGGHNVQAHVHAPDQFARGEPDFELASGWRVDWRNQLQRQPDVARAIFASLDADLSRFTRELNAARGPRMMEVQKELWAYRFIARVMDHEHS